ncbi:TetR family transcriptional regulator [Halioglobus maricola]|uniref:TetR family transcriptional regulator n=1 Tax=Halioglobus maricola TaxID=2601894 RepID=A0A5P9NIG0_9GAMM|nr:TetR/AcrR family transcriptional regulator [Halioglobus maricola]QFU75610.1 TetR family transcriptional regulator [Halioglobus maricola]
MSESTRKQFLQAALKLFAERGFYGASIAAIATELGLTKQALLHHFGTKEKLYGEVLALISAALSEVTDAIIAEQLEPAQRLEALVLAQYQDQMNHPDAARLIMRELLDNEKRAAEVGNWYLKSYLELLVATAGQIDVSGKMDEGRLLAMVYQLLGAAHYFAVSGPTLGQIFGAGHYRQTQNAFEDELRVLIRSRLAAIQ